jgi:hypothetical protein
MQTSDDANGRGIHGNGEQDTLLLSPDNRSAGIELPSPTAGTGTIEHRRGQQRTGGDADAERCSSQRSDSENMGHLSEKSVDQKDPVSWIQYFHGYKCVVMLASLCFGMVTCATTSTVGVYFVALLEEFEAGSALTALISSLCVGIVFVTGLLRLSSF